MADIDLSIGYNDGNAEQVVNKLTVAEEKHEQAVKRNQWAIEKAAKAEEKLNQARIAGIRNAMGAIAQAAQTQQAQEAKTNASLASIVNNFKAMGAAAATAKMDDYFRRATMASDAHAKSIDGVAGRTGAFALRVSDVAKAFVAWQGIQGIVDAVKDSIVGVDDRLKSLGAQLDRRAVSMKTLAASQPNEAAANAVVKEAAGLGRKYELSDSDVAKMYTEAQKVTDTPSMRARAAGVMANLTELTGEADESILAVKGGIRSGLTPEQSGALGWRMKQTTGLDLGKASELSQRFSTPYEGAAFMTEINRLGGYKSSKEQLSAIERTQEALNEDPRVASNKFARFMSSKARGMGADWTTLTESQKIEMIAQVMPDTSAGALEKRGMKADAAREISRLIAHRGDIRKLLAPPPDDLIEQSRAKAESVPYIRAAEKKEQADAANREAELTGPVADKARDYAMRVKAQGLAMSLAIRNAERTGHPYKASFMRWIGSDNLQAQAEGAPLHPGWIGRHVMSSAMEQRAPGRTGEEWLDRSTTAVQHEAASNADPENTEATRELTGAVRELTGAIREGGGDAGYSAPPPRRNTGGERN